MLLMIPILGAFAISAILTPVLVYLGRRYGFTVERSGDGGKGKVVPGYGGIAIFFAVSLPYIALAVYGDIIGADYVNRLFALLLGGSIIFASGLLDDRFDLRWWQKILFQLAAISVLIAFGYKLEFYAYPINIAGIDINPFLRIPMMVLWMLVVTNATNLIDGLDGLCAGIVAIASTTVAIVAMLQHDALMAFLMLTLAGASFGFLLYNFHPAKIYMGDTGSLFLGFTFAGIATIENMKTLALTTILVPVIALAIPILDTVFAVIRRSRKRRSISARDTDHFFHKLVRLGLDQRKTVLLTYGLTGILGLATIVFMYSERPIKQAILIVLILLFGAFLYTLEYLKPTGSPPEDE